VHAWTASAVWGGLDAAARFAEAFGEYERSRAYRRAAGEIKAAVVSRLWDDRAQCFARSAIGPGADGELVLDSTADASIIGLWYFGMLDPADPRMVKTLESIGERLRVRTPIGGIARYEGDAYYRATHNAPDVPGNPWFVCTLWLAQWTIATAQRIEDLSPALDMLVWAVSRALPSGVMAEQVHPTTGEPLSVSPLTWSHAAFVKTVQEFTARRRDISGEP
jgi:GH15 family glucan-1,4-alpha-glucosidase